MVKLRVDRRYRVTHPVSKGPCYVSLRERMKGTQNADTKKVRRNNKSRFKILQSLS